MSINPEKINKAISIIDKSIKVHDEAISTMHKLQRHLALISIIGRIPEPDEKVTTSWSSEGSRLIEAANLPPVPLSVWHKTNFVVRINGDVVANIPLPKVSRLLWEPDWEPRYEQAQKRLRKTCERRLLGVLQNHKAMEVK